MKAELIEQVRGALNFARPFVSGYFMKEAPSERHLPKIDAALAALDKLEAQPPAKVLQQMRDELELLGAMIRAERSNPSAEPRRCTDEQLERCYALRDTMEEVNVEIVTGDPHNTAKMFNDAGIGQPPAPAPSVSVDAMMKAMTREQFEAHVRAEAELEYPQIDGLELGAFRRTYIDARMKHEWPLVEALYAIIDQWDTPNWKLTEPTGAIIAKARAVIEKYTKP